MPQRGAAPRQGRLAKAVEEGNATEEEAEKQEEEEEEEKAKEKEVEVVAPCTLPPWPLGGRDYDAVGAWA